MEDNLFPFIGSKPIHELAAPEVLSALRRIEARGANETARRVRQICRQVFRYAVATGRAERDSSSDLKGALAPGEVRNHAAITDPKQLGALLRVLDGYEGTLVVSARCGLLRSSSSLPANSGTHLGAKLTSTQPNGRFPAGA